MDRYPQLTVFPEVSGRRVWRNEVHTPLHRKLSHKEREVGPCCELADGIYIVTVSANTPPERFLAAKLLNLLSAGKRSTHANGFVPSDNYDSAIAVVGGRVAGGVISDVERLADLRIPLVPRASSERLADRDQVCPIIWDLWVHRAHRRRGLGRQLLQAMAAHFGHGLAELGFRFPISNAAIALLRSMGLKEVVGCR